MASYKPGTTRDKNFLHNRVSGNILVFINNHKSILKIADNRKLIHEFKFTFFFY